MSPGRNDAPVACQVCHKPVDASDRKPPFPFCSRRCQLIDLGGWLSEAYRVPGEPAQDVPAPPPKDGEKE
jgi:endogenous inhibitor of DNA gyrase (YacG/DUF329 family)